MAVLPLQMLSAAMMIHLLVNSFTSIIRGLGKPKLEMKIIIGLNIFILLPGIYFGIKYFGLLGATFAVVLHKIGLVFSAVFVLSREIELRIVDILRAVKNPLLVIAVSGALVYLTYNFLNVDNIFILASIYVCIYAILIYKLEKKMINNLIKKL